MSALQDRARELLAAEAKVLPFRRPSGAVKVRRRSAWRALAGPTLKAIALVGTPVAVGLWLFGSPTFALGRVEIEGNRRVPTEWLTRALAPIEGSNLFRLSLPAVESALAANPWVADVTADKRLPDRLRVRVVEREPAALLRTAGGLVVLDRDGRQIAALEAGEVDGDLLLVSLGGATEVDPAAALAIAGELERAAPDWAATLSEVQLLSEEDSRLYLGAVPFPLAVRRGTLERRLPQLRQLLPELERRYQSIDFVDLRFERRIVFQPSVERS